MLVFFVSRPDNGIYQILQSNLWMHHKHRQAFLGWTMGFLVALHETHLSGGFFFFG